MKKLLIFFLCTIMLSTIILTSCQKEEITEDFKINNNGELIVTYSNGETENLGKIKADEPRGIKSTEVNDAGELIITYTDGTQENLGLIVSENVWRERNDTVYTKGPFNLKSQPSDNFIDNINMTTSTGTELKRIATNGTWNKVKYLNSTYYIKSEYTTTNKDFITFEKYTEQGNSEDGFVKDNTKTVYAKQGIRLYICPYKDISMVATAVPENIEMTQTEVNKTGDWIKVRYGEQEYYCDINDISYTKLYGNG